jgi:hypothetical protein
MTSTAPISPANPRGAVPPAVQTQLPQLISQIERPPQY